MPAHCLGDGLRLSQILTNLLSNAVKFTREGRVTLRICVEKANILTLEVVDTGIGMTSEQLQSLFQPFQQADNSITRKFGGTGLGLSICKRLVDALSGSIHVISTMGEGTRFRVHIPLQKPEGHLTLESIRKKITPPLAESEGRLSGLSLLLAEDNRVNQIVIEEMLTREGCRLTLANSGLEALEQVRASGGTLFDAVLMDIQMPDMDGYEATRKILEVAPRLPVIGLSAHVMHEAIVEGKAAGMCDHVAKPVEREVLVQAIAKQVRPEVFSCLADPDTLQAAQSQTAPDGGGAERIDWVVLAQQYHGQEAFLMRLLQMFHTTTVDKPDQLREAALAGQFGRIAEIAHGIKGLSGDILPAGIRQLARKTEQSATDQSAQSGELSRRLAVALDVLLNEVGHHLETHNTIADDSKKPVLTPSQLEAVLNQIHQLLTVYDTAVNELLDTHAQELRDHYGQAADRLIEQVTLYDYTSALESLTLIQKTTP